MWLSSSNQHTLFLPGRAHNSHSLAKLVCIPTLMAALQLMTHSHSHFWPLTSLFLCIPTSSHCIVCWKPQPSFFSFLNTSLAILLLYWAFFHLSTHLSCSPTHISTLSPQCLHECVRLYTITLTCFTSQTKSLFCRFYFWFCPLQ